MTGPKLKCSACKKIINKTDKRIVYGYNKKPRDKYLLYNNYHCNMDCLSYIHGNAKIELMLKRWPQDHLRAIMEKVYTQSDIDSDSD